MALALTMLLSRKHFFSQWINIFSVEPNPLWPNSGFRSTLLPLQITDVLENITAGLKFVDKLNTTLADKKYTDGDNTDGDKLNTTLADKKYTEDRLQRFNLMGDFKKQVRLPLCPQKSLLSFFN